ncbi:hypothetical protein ACFY5D_09675 [Paeniglutamicibacter sp. NPDC012692]|uniref:hypothetical protein n=1 Tax=Paeniglutamicibacter sp. NPDC012692 TaxID=3364388 RepID=UPI003677CAD6
MTEKETNRKVRAVMAGGLVLGVGAVLTLAAWNSSDFAAGVFGTGAFVLEGSTNGTDFAHHEEASPAALTFGLTAANLSPGESVSAPFAVHLDGTTTYDATVAMNTTFGAGLDGLSYKVFSTAAFGCAEASTGDVVASTPLISGTNVATFDLTKGSSGAAGAAKNLCFVVTAGDEVDLSEGATSTAVWEFAGTQKN